MEDQQPFRCVCCSTQTSQIFAMFKQRLEDVSNSQTTLASNRMQLLVKREKVRSTSCKVQAKRVEAGDAEAAFMSELHSLVNKQRLQLDMTILEAYAKVEQCRDALGEMEENYLQDERDLGGDEWEFMDQENSFYQFDLLSVLPDAAKDESVGLPFAQIGGTTMYPPPPPHPPPPPPPPPSHINVYQPWRLCQEGLPLAPPSPSSVQPWPMTPFSSILKTRIPGVSDKDRAHDIFFSEEGRVPDEDFTASVSCATPKDPDIIEPLFTHEPEARQPKRWDRGLRVQESIFARRFSDPAQLLGPEELASTPIRRTQTESGPPSFRKDATAMDRIQQWLLGHMNDSVLQQRMYLNALEKRGVRDSRTIDWKSRAALYWAIDGTAEREEDENRDASSIIESSRAAKSDEEQRVSEDPPFLPVLRGTRQFDGSDFNYSEFDQTSVAVEPLVRNLPVQDEPGNTPVGPSTSPRHCSAENLETSVPSLIVTLDTAETSVEQTISSGDKYDTCIDCEGRFTGLKRGQDISLRKDSCRDDVSAGQEENQVESLQTHNKSQAQQGKQLEQMIDTAANSGPHEIMPRFTSATTSETNLPGEHIHGIEELTPPIHSIQKLPSVIKNIPEGMNSPLSSTIAKAGIDSVDKSLETTSTFRPNTRRCKSASAVLKSFRSRLFREKTVRSKSTPSIKEQV